jgi:Spy/CpxP family protein refolding chaperone
VKNKLTIIVAVLTVAGLMAVGSVAYAAVGGKGPKKDIFQSLNLTPEQTKKIDVLREAQKTSAKAEIEQLKAKTEALHAQIAMPGTKRADVNGLISEVNAIRGQIFSQRIDGLFAIKEVLTPEQYAKFQELKKANMNKGAMAKKRKPLW